jgi:hypothetical protein
MIGNDDFVIDFETVEGAGFFDRGR